MVINWHTFYRKDGRLNVHQASIYRSNLRRGQSGTRNGSWKKRKQQYTWLLKYFSFLISLHLISLYIIHYTARLLFSDSFRILYIFFFFFLFFFREQVETFARERRFLEANLVTWKNVTYGKSVTSCCKIKEANEE